MTRWQDQARCAGSPLAWWFPHKNDETPALKICARCPVRQECLDDAIETGETTYGIRGGLTPVERIALAKTLIRNKNMRVCLQCDIPLPPGVHRNAQVHDACRRAYRARKQLARNRARRARERANRPPKQCEICQASLDGRGPKAKYCQPCARARATAKQRNYAARRREHNTPCEWCGKLAPIFKPMHARCARAKAAQETTA